MTTSEDKLTWTCRHGTIYPISQESCGVGCIAGHFHFVKNNDDFPNLRMFKEYKSRVREAELRLRMTLLKSDLMDHGMTNGEWSRVMLDLISKSIEKMK